MTAVVYYQTDKLIGTVHDNMTCKRQNFSKNTEGSETLTQLSRYYFSSTYGNSMYNIYLHCFWKYYF